MQIKPICVCFFTACLILASGCATAPSSSSSLSPASRNPSSTAEICFKTGFLEDFKSVVKTTAHFCISDSTVSTGTTLRQAKTLSLHSPNEDLRAVMLDVGRGSITEFEKCRANKEKCRYRKYISFFPTLELQVETDGTIADDGLEQGKLTFMGAETYYRQIK